MHPPQATAVTTARQRRAALSRQFYELLSLLNIFTRDSSGAYSDMSQSLVGIWTVRVQ
jgi:hypothetical protein